MAKEKETYRRCENCNALIEDASPHTTQQYKQGLITIGEFSHVALDKPSKSTTHTKEIDGVYCNLDCLIKRLKKIRKWPKQ